GTFWYTGEGQVGDMKWERGNAAIREHQRDKKTLLLFEYVAPGQVRFIGEATYLGHHTEQRPDRNNQARDAIVFELEINATPSASDSFPFNPASFETPQARLWMRPLEEVRRLAVARPPVTSSAVVRRVITRQRSEAVRVYVLRRANGTCEGC